MPKGIYKRTEWGRKNMSEARLGKMPWNWKKHHSKESNEKNRIAHLGKKLSAENIENLRRINTGRKHSPESILKMRNAKTGKKFTKEHRENLRKSNTGKKHTLETRMKMSGRTGEKSPSWKGGLTPMNLKIRQSFEYKLWRESVFERDDYSCVFCGLHGVKLHADHIKPFAHYPELRFAIDNGRTLCVPCHRTTETWGGRTK